MQDYRVMPIYQKGEEVIELIRAIIASFDDSKDSYEIGQLMMENAYLITNKIAKAEGENWYSKRLENATLIKLSAKELISQLQLIKNLELTDPGYIRVMEDEIDDFRIIFLEWVASFNEDNDYIDEWSFHHL